MNPREELPPDPEALEKWRQLPQTVPSKNAYPPVTGGMAWNRALMVGILFFAVIAGIVVLISTVSQP